MKIIFLIACYFLLMHMWLPSAAALSLVEIKEQRQKAIEEMHEKRTQLLQEMNSRREGFRTEAVEERSFFGKRTGALIEEMRLKRAEMLHEMREARTVFRSQAEERRLALARQFEEGRADRIENFFARMAEKLEAAIDRLDAFGDKIEERIARAADNGNDVFDSYDKLVGAREKIDEARVGLQSAREKYSRAALGPDFKKAFTEVRESVLVVSKKIREAHAALVEVIISLKGLGEKRETPDNHPEANE